jgi:hypothetical protein
VVGITEEYSANAQTNAEEVNEKNTLGGTTKHPGHSMVQMVMANILDPLFEILGLPPDHPEYSNVSHVKDEYPENQQW